MSLPARQQHTFLLATFEWLPSKPPAADNSHIIIHPAAYPIIIHESNIHTQILQHTQGFLSLSFEFLTPPKSTLTWHTHLPSGQSSPNSSYSIDALVAKESDVAKNEVSTTSTVPHYCAKLWQAASRSSSGKIAPQERLQMPLRKGFRLQASRREDTPPSREDRKLLLGGKA